MILEAKIRLIASATSEARRKMVSFWVMRRHGCDRRRERSDTSAGSLAVAGCPGQMHCAPVIALARRRPAPRKMRGTGLNADWVACSRAGERRPFVGDIRPGTRVGGRPSGAIRPSMGADIARQLRDGGGGLSDQ